MIATRWIRAWAARKPAPATGAGQYGDRHARAPSAKPATRNAAPMSWTKCGLYGPVSDTPGTFAYQDGPANSIIKPLRTDNAAKIAAIDRRMGTSYERRGVRVTGPAGSIWDICAGRA